MVKIQHMANKDMSS